MNFCTIASGSSGNSIFMGTEHTKILIDAGVSGKRILEGLEKLSLTGDQIDALFITHEHIDHVKGAGVFSRKFDVPTMPPWKRGTLWKAVWARLPHAISVLYTKESLVSSMTCV